jgi:hypothetical protein
MGCYNQRKKVAHEGQEVKEIEQEIYRLANKCVRAGVSPHVAANYLWQAAHEEQKRMLVEAEGLVKK